MRQIPRGDLLRQRSMKTHNPIKLGINTALQSAGFLRKATTWYRDMEETVLVVNLQKSNYGDHYYVNVAVLVKGLPVTQHKVPPNENNCHIRLRLEHLADASDERRIQLLLDLEDGSLTSFDRQEQIERDTTRMVLPFLTRCTTRDGIRSAHLAGLLDRALVHRAVQDQVLS